RSPSRSVKFRGRGQPEDDPPLDDYDRGSRGGATRRLTGSGPNWRRGRRSREPARPGSSVRLPKAPSLQNRPRPCRPPRHSRADQAPRGCNTALHVLDLFAIAGMTLIGIVLNRVMRSILMWFRINRMRLSRGSDGSHLAEYGVKGENDEDDQGARARGCARVRISGWRVRAAEASGGCGQGGGCG